MLSHLYVNACNQEYFALQGWIIAPRGRCGYSRFPPHLGYPPTYIETRDPAMQPRTLWVGLTFLHWASQLILRKLSFGLYLIEVDEMVFVSRNLEFPTVHTRISIIEYQ